MTDAYVWRFEMKRTVECTFEIESWEEQPIDEAVPKLTRASVTKRFGGDVDGTSAMEYVMAYRDDGTASFVGLERLDATIEGRRGALVLRHVGTFEDGAARAAVHVAESSGMEGLADVAGDGEFLADPAGSMRLHLEFA